MRYPILLVAAMCLLTASSCTFRVTPDVKEDYFRAVDATTLSYPSINVDSLQVAHPNNAAIILGATTLIKHGFAFLEPFTARVVRATRMVVLDPNDTDVGLIAESFYSTVNVADIDVVVIQPDGSRYQRSIRDFTYTSLDQRYFLRLQLEDLHRGSIIDVAFHLRADRRDRFMFEEPVYRSWRYPCLVERLECYYPKSEVLVTKHIPTKLTATTIVDEPGHYVSESKNTAGIHWEPYSPPRVYMNSIFQWDTFDPAKTVEYSSFWHFAREKYNWLFEYVMYDAIDENDLEMTKEIRFKGDSTRLDSLQSVTDWFRRRFKYNENAIYVSTVPQCLRYRHGTAIELSAILRKVCRSFNWPAQIGLVYQSLRGQFDSSFYSSAQMNEYVVAVGETSSLALVFFLRKDQPVNVVPAEFIGQPIFYLTPESDDPVMPPYDTVSHVITVPTAFRRDYNVELKDDGSATVSSTFTFEGTWAVDQRSEWGSMSSDRVESDIRSSYVFDQVETRNVKIDIANLHNPLVPLIVTVSYTIPLAMSEAGSTSIFQTAGLARSIADQALRIDANRRVNPIVLNEDAINETVFKCTYPTGWQLSCDLASASVQNPMGNMERVVERNSGAFVLNAHTSMKHGWYPPASAADLQSLIGERSHHDIPTLVFTSTR